MAIQINNYKELVLYLYLENSNDMYLRIKDNKYYISLNKKNWYLIKKSIGKQLKNKWGIEVI